MNWNALSAIGTVAAAAATVFMVILTYIAIRSGQRQFLSAQQKEDARHQDAYRPIVVLEPFGGVEAESRGHTVAFDSSSRMGNRRLFKIACVVRNVGVGPALNVRLSFRAMGKPGYGFTQELVPVGTGETQGNAAHALAVWAQSTPSFNDADMAQASGTGWELVLEYEDVFANRFHTIHRKNPQVPWTECGRGAAPVPSV